MPPLDSRRLTGPGLLLDRPGAVLEALVDESQGELAIEAWRTAIRQMLEAVGWSGETLAVRRYRGGVALALSAPVDALYAATEINEWAWSAAEAAIGQGPAVEPKDAAAARLKSAIAAERNPPLLALRRVALSRGVTFLSDEEWVSVGSGTGVRFWPSRALPAPEEVDWEAVHDIPVALITGSNGKTTVVRLLSAMVSAAGRLPGLTTTDGVRVGDSVIAEGDWSGSSGARLVLRRPEVETAVLETARGGLLRRGLAVQRAAVAVITNISDDHLGEFGINDLEELADTKLLVAGAVGPAGRVVLNAEDPILARPGRSFAAPVTWFSLDPELPLIREHLAVGGRAALLTSEGLALVEGQERTLVVEPGEVPIVLDGAARHNLANALAALGAAEGLGLSTEAMQSALREFGRRLADNPGRTNLIELSGVRIVIDYAHNPHGMTALAETIAELPSARRLVMLGQAGDRSDEAIRELARAALGIRPDRIVIKEMKAYLRGRAEGEIPALLSAELRRSGVPPDAIATPGSELDSTRDALAWARPGDLLVLTVHDDRRAVLHLLQELGETAWKPGEPLPPPTQQ
jgi:cyanophycin synthetase